MKIAITTSDFQCLECKEKLTFEQAEEIVNGDDRCPGCGGCDIDIAVD